MRSFIEGILTVCAVTALLFMPYLAASFYQMSFWIPVSVKELRSGLLITQFVWLIFLMGVMGS